MTNVVPCTQARERLTGDEEITLMDIFLRELIRKSPRMKHDLRTYEKPKMGPRNTPIYEPFNRSETCSLVKGFIRTPEPAMKSIVPRHRAIPDSRSNSRDSSRSASPSRPPSPVFEGICYDFQHGKCTRGDKRKDLHKPRSQSPQPRKVKKTCMLWREGKCNKGDKCLFKHEGPPGKPGGPSRPPRTSQVSPPGEEQQAKITSPPKRRSSRGKSRGNPSRSHSR